MTTPPWHHICQLTLITSIEVNLPSPYWRLLVIHAECQVLFVARFVFKSSQTCYAASHVLSVQLCLACVFDTVWAGRCSRSHAVPFANSSTRPGNELEPPPSFAFNSIYVWVWYLAQAALVMHDIFNVRWERMWFEFGCGRSLLLWIELKVVAYLVASGGRTRVNRSRLYSTIVGFGWTHASGHVVQTSHLLNLQSKRPRARLKPRVPTCWFEVFYTS